MSDQRWDGQNPQQGQGGDWQSSGGQGGDHFGQPRQQARGRRGKGPSPLRPGQTSAANAIPEERMAFIRRTYSWLTGAIFLCAAMMALFWNSPAFEPVITFMVNANWLIVLALFIGFSWLGDAMARRVDSKGLQIIGLTVGVGAYAIIFSYLFAVTGAFDPSYGVGTDVVWQAGLLTLVTFSGLTAVVFFTKQDFSFLRTALAVGTVLILGAIVAGVLFGFNLGLGFSIFMVGFTSAVILYQTSSILHEYPVHGHVSAALALFSSIGMMFWYLYMILGAGE